MPSDEEFQAMYERGCIDLRDKFLLAFLRQTGLRGGAVEGLKLRHVKDLVINEETGELKLTNEFPAILVYAGYREEYITFLSPDGAQMMIQYLQSRSVNKVLRGEKKEIQRAGEKLTPDSPLFAKATRRGGSEILTISGGMVHQLVKAISGRAGFGGKFKPQSFRRLCQNLLERGGVHPTRIEALMGHRLGLKAHYSIAGMASDTQQKIEELRSEYKKAESHMRVSPKQGLSEDDVRRQVILENARLAFANRPDVLKQIEKAVKIRMSPRHPQAGTGCLERSGTKAPVTATRQKNHRSFNLQ